MKSSRTLVVTAVAAVVLGTAGAGIAAASGGSDPTEGLDQNFTVVHSTTDSGG